MNSNGTQPGIVPGLSAKNFPVPEQNQDITGYLLRNIRKINHVLVKFHLSGKDARFANVLRQAYFQNLTNQEITEAVVSLRAIRLTRRQESRENSVTGSEASDNQTEALGDDESICSPEMLTEDQDDQRHNDAAIKYFGDQANFEELTTDQGISIGRRLAKALPQSINAKVRHELAEFLVPYLKRLETACAEREDKAANGAFLAFVRAYQVTLAYTHKAKGQNSLIRERIKAVEDGVRLNLQRPERQNGTRPTTVSAARIENLLRHGYTAKAARTIRSEGKVTLVDLHDPVAQAKFSSSFGRKDILTSIADLTNQDREQYEPKIEALEKIYEKCSSKKSRTASDVYGINPLHMYQLQKANGAFNDAVLAILERVHFGYMPPLMRVSRLILLKTVETNKVRPIQIETYFSRMAAATLVDLSNIRDVVQEQFPEYCAGVALGQEVMYFSTFDRMINGGNCLTIMDDVVSAYDRVVRSFCLQVVQDQVPSIYPFMHAWLSKETTVVLDDGTTKVISCGAGQGNPLMVLVFALVFKRVLEKTDFQATVVSSSEAVHRQFVDDSAIVIPEEDLPRFFEWRQKVNQMADQTGISYDTRGSKLRIVSFADYTASAKKIALEQDATMATVVAFNGPESVKLMGIEYGENDVVNKAAVDKVFQKMHAYRNALKLKQLHPKDYLHLVRQTLIPMGSYFLRFYQVNQTKDQAEQFDIDIRHDVLSEVGIRNPAQQGFKFNANSLINVPIRDGGLGIRSLAWQSYVGLSSTVYQLRQRVKDTISEESSMVTNAKDQLIQVLSRYCNPQRAEGWFQSIISEREQSMHRLAFSIMQDLVMASDRVSEVARSAYRNINRVDPEENKYFKAACTKGLSGANGPIHQNICSNLFKPFVQARLRNFSFHTCFNDSCTSATNLTLTHDHHNRCKLNAQGIATRQHDLVKEKIAKQFRSMGCKVIVEAPMGGGARMDLVVSNLPVDTIFADEALALDVSFVSPDADNKYQNPVQARIARKRKTYEKKCEERNYRLLPIIMSHDGLMLNDSLHQIMRLSRPKTGYGGRIITHYTGAFGNNWWSEVARMLIRAQGLKVMRSHVGSFTGTHRYLIKP